MRPPAINISITGEHPVPSSTPFWTTIQNKVYEETAKLRLTAEERPFLGRVSNKGLHISDGVEPKEEKKGRNIKAVMAIHCRQEDGQLGQEIGSFESKEIKIVSKPSKKRSSARTSDRECLAFLRGSESCLIPNACCVQCSCSMEHSSPCSIGSRHRQARPNFWPWRPTYASSPDQMASLYLFPWT